MQLKFTEDEGEGDVCVKYQGAEIAGLKAFQHNKNYGSMAANSAAIADKVVAVLAK